MLLQAFEEKYRPNTFDDIIQVNDAVDKIKTRLENGIFQHYLLVGSAGTGKTSTAYLIAEHFLAQNNREFASNQIHYYNASTMGINDIRDNVEKIVRMTGSHVIILDEFDGITMQSQHALRPIMEEAKQTKNPKLFVLTANYPEKIIDPIKSRCGGEVFEFPIIPFEKMKPKLLSIIKNEGIKSLEQLHFPEQVVTQEDKQKHYNSFLDSIYKNVRGDMRRAISRLQQYIVQDQDNDTVFLNMTSPIIQIEANGFSIVLDQILLNDREITYAYLGKAVRELLYDQEKDQVWSVQRFFEEAFDWLKNRAEQLDFNLVLDYNSLIAKYEDRMTRANTLELQLTAMVSDMRRAKIENELKRKLNMVV